MTIEDASKADANALVVSRASLFAIAAGFSVALYCRYIALFFYLMFVFIVFKL